MLYKNKFRICLTNNKDDEYISIYSTNRQRNYTLMLSVI